MKTELIGPGNECPKCRKVMQRFQHGAGWKLKERQPYYYTYWDKCTGGHHIQMYEAAKVFCAAPVDDLEREFRDIFTQDAPRQLKGERRGD